MTMKKREQRENLVIASIVICRMNQSDLKKLHAVIESLIHNPLTKRKDYAKEYHDDIVGGSQNE